MVDARSPWELLPIDTASSFHAFAHYRDLAPSIRSLLRAWQAHFDGCDTTRQRRGKRSMVPRHWENWSSLNAWVTRAREWDIEADRIMRQERSEHRDLMYSGQRTLSRNVLSIVSVWIQALAADRDKITAMSPHQMNVLWETASKIERLLTGVPETVVYHDTTIPPPAPDEEQEPDDEYLANYIAELAEVGIITIEGMADFGIDVPGSKAN